MSSYIMHKPSHTSFHVMLPFLRHISWLIRMYIFKWRNIHKPIRYIDSISGKLYCFSVIKAYINERNLSYITIASVCTSPITRLCYLAISLRGFIRHWRWWLWAIFEESDDSEGPNIRKNSEIDNDYEEEKNGSSNISSTVSQASLFLPIPPIEHWQWRLCLSFPLLLLWLIILGKKVVTLYFYIIIVESWTVSDYLYFLFLFYGY